MGKYSNLLWSAFLSVIAVGVIVWIIRESSARVAANVSAAPTSPDETHGETLNGLEPLNAQVDVAQAFLNYNVPQPGNVAPINDSNQSSLTMGQAFAIAGADADESIANLLAIGLPATDFVN